MMKIKPQYITEFSKVKKGIEAKLLNGQGNYKVAKDYASLELYGMIYRAANYPKKTFLEVLEDAFWNVDSPHCGDPWFWAIVFVHQIRGGEFPYSTLLGVKAAKTNAFSDLQSALDGLETSIRHDEHPVMCQSLIDAIKKTLKEKGTESQKAIE